MSTEITGIEKMRYDFIPVGTTVQYTSDIIPLGYLLCDGRNISRSSYPELYDLIGDKLPDYRNDTVIYIIKALHIAYPSVEYSIVDGLNAKIEGNYNELSEGLEDAFNRAEEAKNTVSEHTMTSSSHNANASKMFYSDENGKIAELNLAEPGKVLTINMQNGTPLFEDLPRCEVEEILSIFSYI
ncbi:MAG: phage tail protein [Cetobacterium sp.]